MSGLQLVSLFAGVGGFDVAAERLGIPTIAAVEIDNAARGVLAHRFPEASLFDDVRNVTADDLRAAGAVPDRTILVGGFPCQPFSVAGRRQGLDDDKGRGDLYFEISRLMADFAPAWVVLENVPGLLSIDGGRTMGTILRDLGERGYGFCYRVLDAQHFGVPQRRRRVFIVGRLGDDRGPVQVLLEPEGSDRDSAPSGTPGTIPAAGSGAGPDGPSVVGTLSGGGLAAGGPQRTTQPTGYSSPRRAVAALTSNGVGTCGPDDNQAQAGHLIPFVKTVRSGARDEGGGLPPEVWAMRETSPTLNVMDNTGESRATVLAITGAVTHALTSEGADASEDGTGRGTPIVTALTTRSGATFDDQQTGQLIPTATAVRRLTPRECERLQGFPDDWTLYRIDPIKGVVQQADSARYKQMGNAVAVPVVEWILARLQNVHATGEPS